MNSMFDDWYDPIPNIVDQIWELQLSDSIVRRSDYNSQQNSTVLHSNYNSQQKILVVGDGDFSFSACLAKAFGSSASNMVATSLDSHAFLLQNYTKAMHNLSQLKRRRCLVIHEFDATKMASDNSLASLEFDRIIFNFPHAGFTDRGTASQQTQIRKHQALVRGFLANAKKMLAEDGQIHITHKCNGFHFQWQIVSLASSQGLQLLEEVPFKLEDYPGYNTKYGFGGDRNFDCYPSNTYKFVLKEYSYEYDIAEYAINYIYS